VESGHTISWRSSSPSSVHSLSHSHKLQAYLISQAYISISLDCTGLLRYLAFLVASRSSSSGNLLFLSFYTFFALSGLLIGNDPLILSGTPFLVYFTRHAKVDPPTAYLFTHFQVSNLVSALLVSSNPTNLILTSAFGLSFLQYSAWLALPTLAGAVVLFPILRFVVFRGERMIPRTLSPPKVDPKSALVDPLGGIFGASLFLVTIVCLVSLSAGGLLEGVEGVWTVTAPAALIMLVRDCVHDVIVRKRDEERREKEELVRVKEGRKGGYQSLRWLYVGPGEGGERAWRAEERNRRHDYRPAGWWRSGLRKRRNRSRSGSGRWSQSGSCHA